MEEGRFKEVEALLQGEPSPEARFALGYALAFQGRHAEALALYRGLYEETGSHRAVHQVGMVLRMAGRLEEALAVFEEEARLLPLTPWPAPPTSTRGATPGSSSGKRRRAWPFFRQA